MNYITQARELIRKNEDCCLKVYDDATGHLVGPGDRLNGHPTIGWGRALDVHGIDRSEADRLLHDDIEASADALKKQQWSFWEELSVLRKAVLVDMTYNMGIGHLLQFSKMIQALKIKNYTEAARQIKRSAYFHQTGRRAKQNCYIMKFDKFISHQQAKNYFKTHIL